MLAAMAVAGLLASSAQAASTTPGDFSSYITDNPTIGYVDDCTVEVGPVVDSVPAPDYRKIGGVRVNCDSVHSVINATVWEQYWDGSEWVDWGDNSVRNGYDETGSGLDESGILSSPPSCSPDPGYPYAWRTAALVQTENDGAYVYSAEKVDSSGC
jgi:hypothetical protein